MKLSDEMNERAERLDVAHNTATNEAELLREGAALLDEQHEALRRTAALAGTLTRTFEVDELRRLHFDGKEYTVRAILDEANATLAKGEGEDEPRFFASEAERRRFEKAKGERGDG